MTTLSKIRVTNATMYARNEPSFFQCVAPLKQGAAFPGDQLRLDSGEPCEIVPFGALWPDGSYRTVLVRGWTTITKATRKTVGVEAMGAGATASPLAITGKSADVHFPLVSVGGEATLATKQPQTRSSARWRSPDGELWLQLDLEIAPTASHLYWYLTVGWSNPLSPASNWTMPYPLELSAPAGTRLSCYWAAMKAVSSREDVGGGNTLSLLPAGTVWGDGQMHCWRGAMLLSPSEAALAALELPLYALASAESWRESGAWGAFGAVPARPSWWPNDQAGIDWVHRKIRERDAAPRADPWHEQKYGLRKVPGATGDQMDFGVMNCMAAVITGEPTALDLYLQDALQDSCRPTHFCEADGSLVRSRNHPQWECWDQETHFNAGVSLDRLGKAPFTNKETHGWHGRDNQHWSSNLICCSYYLTGDPQLALLIDHECETYLAQQILPLPPFRPGWPGTGPDAARAVGRTMLAGSWMYLCTGRVDIKERIKQRIDLSIYPGWQGRQIGYPYYRPYMISKTDGRQTPIPLNSDASFPWQEGIAATGLEAAYRITGQDNARELAAEIARCMCDFGWQWRAGHTDAQVANCIVWNQGNDVDRYDPLKFQPADGTDFMLWVQPATILAASVYQNSQDAQALANIVQARYVTPPSDGGPGRYQQWSTVLGAPIT